MHVNCESNKADRGMEFGVAAVAVVVGLAVFVVAVVVVPLAVDGL